MAGEKDEVGSGFRSVDEQADPAMFFLVLDLQAKLPAILRLREHTAAMVSPRPGMRILDVGCGTGEVARALASSVMPGGAVTAVDLSERMLIEARRRTEGTNLPVTFLSADAQKLDMEGATFDPPGERRIRNMLQPRGGCAWLNLVDPDRIVTPIRAEPGRPQQARRPRRTMRSSLLARGLHG